MNMDNELSPLTSLSFMSDSMSSRSSVLNFSMSSLLIVAVLSEEAETDVFLFLITSAVTSRPNIIVVIKNIIVVAIKGLNDFLGFIIYLLCNSLSVKEILI